MIRSTQTVEQNSAANNGNAGGAAVSVASALPGAARQSGGDSSKSVSDHTEETTNYEISKTVKTSTQDGGDVKRLSVAVVVDGSGDTAKPRSAAEMAQITSLVKSAMGFDTARGDQVQVTNMAVARVAATDATPAPKPLLGLDNSYWFKIIEAAIMSLTALLIGLFVVRPLITRMFAPNSNYIAPHQIGGSAPSAGALPAPDGSGQPGATVQLPAPAPSIDISHIEGQVRDSSIKKIGEVVDAHPEEALAIIRTWLHQPV